MAKMVIKMTKSNENKSHENNSNFESTDSEMGPNPTWSPTPPGPHNHHYHPYRKLYRSQTQKWLGGVCGGLAKYFNTDPLLIRLLWVVVSIASLGLGIIGYLLFWIFVKKEPSQYTLSKEYVTRDENGNEHRHYHYKVTE